MVWTWLKRRLGGRRRPAQAPGPVPERLAELPYREPEWGDPRAPPPPYQRGAGAGMLEDIVRENLRVHREAAGRSGGEEEPD